jgi:hypothetical protein
MSEQCRSSFPLDWQEHAVPQRVVEAVATVEDREMTEMEPLADSIDPDALEEVFAGPRRDRGNVTFRYAGHEVTVYAHGEVVVQ